MTTVPRTFLDIAPLLDDRQLARALEEADSLRLLRQRALIEICDRHPRASGVGRLRRAAEALAPVPAIRSELERAFLELCRDHSIPEPLVNATVVGLEVDALWPRQCLVVEVDGFEFHRTRSAFEEDRRRDAVLQLAGYRVIRLTHRRLAQEPKAVAELLRRSLALSPPRG